MSSGEPIYQRLYNRFIRPAALRGFGPRLYSLGGVIINGQAATDATRRHEYKPVIRSVIRETVADGNHVVDIATGRGVFAVTAARSGATVDTYEAAAERVADAREVARLNFVDDRMTVHHALVSEPADVSGAIGDAKRINPADLPTANVLILDVEGAELQIIPGVEPPPETVIVETHPENDAPAERVRSVLADRGYSIDEQRELGANATGHVITAVQE